MILKSFTAFLCFFYLLLATKSSLLAMAITISHKNTNNMASGYFSPSKKGDYVVYGLPSNEASVDLFQEHSKSNLKDYPFIKRTFSGVSKIRNGSIVSFKSKNSRYFFLDPKGFGGVDAVLKMTLEKDHAKNLQHQAKYHQN